MANINCGYPFKYYPVTDGSSSSQSYFYYYNNDMNTKAISFYSNYSGASWDIIGYSSQAAVSETVVEPDIKMCFVYNDIETEGFITLSDKQTKTIQKDKYGNPVYDYTTVQLTAQQTSSVCKVAKQHKLTGSFSVKIKFYARTPYQKGELAIGTVLTNPDGSTTTVTSNSGSGYYNDTWYDVTSTAYNYHQQLWYVKYQAGAPSFNNTTLSSDYTGFHHVFTSATTGSHLTGSMSYFLPWDCVSYKIHFSNIPFNDITGTKSTPADLSETIERNLTATVTDSAKQEADGYKVYDGRVSIACKDYAERETTVETRFSWWVLYYETPLTVNSYRFFRCNSAHQPALDGNVIGIQYDVDWDPHWWSRWSDFADSVTYNANTLTVTVDIYRLLDQNTKLYETSITGIAESAIKKQNKSTITNYTKGTVYIEDFEFNPNYSYFCNIRFADVRSNIHRTGVVGTQPAYLEVVEDERHMAIGKMAEIMANGLEVQFPAKFSKNVIYLPQCKDFYHAAAAIPYKDTHAIGATNVQQALNWILGRL